MKSVIKTIDGKEVVLHSSRQEVSRLRGIIRQWQNQGGYLTETNVRALISHATARSGLKPREVVRTFRERLRKA
jgi:hypothetical protein